MKSTREEREFTALEIALLRYGGILSLAEAVRTETKSLEKPKK